MNMKAKLLIAFATFFLIACGNKVAPPESAEEDNLSVNLPEYNLVSIDEPKISSNGSISPIQNLIYNIEIDHPLQKDSLELLQDYFIQKGKKDFIGINKVIVRAYLKGTQIHGLPYASLNLVGAEKEIIINEGAIKIDSLTKTKETSTTKVQEGKEVKEVGEPFFGTYFCERTHDTYVFKSDKTGFFTIQGGISPSEFTWKRSGNTIIVLYEVFGEQKLTYNPNTETLTEKSESFGTLVFHKQ